MELFVNRPEFLPRSGMSRTLLRNACRGIIGSNRMARNGLPSLLGPRPVVHPGMGMASPFSRLSWRGCQAAAPATEASPAAEQAAEGPIDGTFKSTAYPFTEIETKWQAFWEEHQTFRTPDFKDLDTSKPKFYALDMFPYPRYAINNQSLS